MRLAGVFASLGVTKIRLTGGEPLLRTDLADIVAGIARLGIPDIALTTNGALLRRWALRLREAGLHRVTVSLDSLDPVVFSSMSDSKIEVDSVLDGIAAAREAGLDPIKLNCVVQRGVNEADSSISSTSPEAKGSACAASSTWTSARPMGGA